jgi:hypothetical protein
VASARSHPSTPRPSTHSSSGPRGRRPHRANALWSWLFFGWRLGALASLEVLVLLALIAATLLAFARVSRAAALLLVPYLL